MPYPPRHSSQRDRGSARRVGASRYGISVGTVSFIVVVGLTVVLAGIFLTPPSFEATTTPTVSMVDFLPSDVIPAGVAEARDMTALLTAAALLLLLALAVSVTVWGSLKGLVLLSGKSRRSIEWMLGASPNLLLRQGLAPWPRGIMVPVASGAALGGAAVALLVGTRPEGVFYLGATWFKAVSAVLLMVSLQFILTAWRVHRERATYGGLAAANAGRATETAQQRFVRTLLVGVQGAVSVGLIVAAGLLTTSGATSSALAESKAGEDSLLLAHVDFGGPEGIGVDQRALALQRAWATLDQASAVIPESLATPGAWSGRGPEVTALNECGQCFTGLLPHPVHAAAIRVHIVFPGFFAERLEVIEGRTFTINDTASTNPVAVVTVDYAHAHFQDGGALGREISLDGLNGPWHEVVGVVETPTVSGLGHSGASFAAYFTALQHPPPDMEFLVRIPQAPGDEIPGEGLVLEELRTQLEGLTEATPPSNLKVRDVRAVPRELSRLTGPARWLGQAGWLAGLTAAILAAFGLARAVSHHVGQRTVELGIRSSLGAGPRQLQTLVLREAAMLGLALTLGGLWLGMLIAAPALEGISNFVAPRLFLTVGFLSMFLVVGSALPAAIRVRLVEPRMAMATHMSRDHGPNQRSHHRRGQRLGGSSLLPVVVFATQVFLSGCTPPAPPPPDLATLQEDVEAWRVDRYEDLRKSGSWLSLTGLFWLTEGVSTFGASTDNDLVFPGQDLPNLMGTVTLRPNAEADQRFQFEAAPGVDIQLVEETLTTAFIHSNEGDTAMTYGTLTWYPIERDGRFAIRLTDDAAPTRLEFDEIEAFPVNLAARITGRFEPYDPPRTLEFPTVFGGVERQESAGEVVLTIGGEKVRLSVEGAPGRERYRVTFADLTNGIEIYGGGRYVWFDAEDEEGWITIDFNQAYNPPCVFTEFATCALPPREHRIPARIEGGEKVHGVH